jgi:KUP system potassium uptake protein
MPLNMDGTISSGDSIVSLNGHMHNNTAVASSGLLSNPAEVNELEFLGVCRDAGVVHILGNTEILARRDSKFYKKIAIDHIYAFLRKICRQNSAALNVPHESLLNVGQIIHV